MKNNNFRNILKRQKNKPAYNIGLAIWRLKCFYETFPEVSGQVVQGSALGILLNFGANNLPHRQAENRMAVIATFPDFLQNRVIDGKIFLSVPVLK